MAKMIDAARPALKVRRPGQRRAVAWGAMPAPRLLPEFLEGQLTIVLAQEVQELLVVARIHVEQLAHDLVVAAGLLQPFTDDVADVLTGDLALHVERIDRGPERFALFGQLLVEIVGDGAAAFALRPQGDAALGADFGREV